MSFTDHAIDKNSPLPLYYQLKQIILAEVKAGNLKSNDRLPVEFDLCDMYGLSRTTVRQAISELVSEGYLYKEKNRGVFVAMPRAKVDSIYSTHYFNESAKAAGFNPSCRISAMQVIPANATVAKALQLKPGTDVIYVEKWCYANDILVAINEYYFVHPLCSSVMDEKAYRKFSAYELLNQNAETYIGHISKTVSAYSASAEEARIFDIPEGAAMFLADDIGYAQRTGLPISYEHVRLVGSRTHVTWEFQMKNSTVQNS